VDRTHRLPRIGESRCRKENRAQLIVRICKSKAEVTNNKNSAQGIVEANY